MPATSWAGCRRAFAREVQAKHQGWIEGIADGSRPAGYFGLPDPLSRGAEFVDLCDHPSWYGYLQDFADGDVVLLAPQVRVVPPSPISYTGWHPDVPTGHVLHMKVQVYVDDAPTDGGAFAYVPGSYRPDTGPYPRVRDQAAMPGHKVLPGAAGTAILFSAYGWHTSMVNRTDTPRRSIILIYEKRAGQALVGPEVPYADQLTTTERRRFFRLEQ